MLSKNILRLRQLKGLSQDELASRLNVVRQTVSKWEKGTSIPSADSLGEMAKIFGVRMEELMQDNVNLVVNEQNFKLVDKTFYQVINEHAILRPDLVAFTYNDKDYTFFDLRNAIDTFASRLIANGVKPGDKVGLWAYNSYSWVVAFFGIIRAGAVSVLVNYRIPSTDVAAILKYTDAGYVVYGETREIKKGSEALDVLKSGLSIDDNALISISDDEFDNCVETVINVEDEPKRTSVMMFTSGTSSDPKAVMLSQYSMLNVSVAQAHILGDRLGNVCMAALPLFHSFGIQTMLTYIYLGRRHVIISSIKPDNVLDLVEKYEISDLYSVASVYLALIDLPTFHHSVEPYVKICVIGGALAKANHMIRLDQAFSNAIFSNGYGQTESSPGITMTRPSDSLEKRLNTVGKPFPLVDVKIMDSERAFLGENEVGEIVLKGYNLMNGYYKLEESRQAIDSEGWLHTGDRGYFDEEGYLHFEGRIKDIIIKNGENIAPKEVEGEILNYGNIIDAKVFGAPHPIWGESIEACLHVAENIDIDVEDLKNYLKDKLAPFKVPSHFFIYNSFPLQSNGKINQRGLKEDMLVRLRDLNISKGLDKGICTISTTVAALPYGIDMVTNMLESIAENLDYDNRKIRRIGRAARAFMTERILYAKNSIEKIEIAVVFYKDKLRITFCDSGNFINVDKLKTKNPNLMIVDDCADAFFVYEEVKKSPLYCLEFAYDDGFDIKKYLMHYGSDGSSIK